MRISSLGLCQKRLKIAEIVDAVDGGTRVRKHRAEHVLATKTARSEEEPPASGSLSVSIILVTHNGAEIVSDCIDSLAKLGTPPEEIIVVDNASSDRTLDEVAKWMPNARILSLEANNGYGAGCNAGAREARGDIIVFLNQDVYLSRAFVADIQSRMASDPAIGVCGGIVLSWDGTRMISAGQVFDPWTGYILDYGFGSAHVDLRRATDDVFSPNGAAFAVRRSTFNEVGGFYEDFFMYFDETDLSWRIRLAGFRAVCCPSATVRHNVDPRRAHRPSSRYYVDRNSLLSAVRNYELSSLAIFLPASIGARILGIVVLILLRRSEHAQSTTKALVDFVLRFPRAWKERGPIAAMREVSDRELLNVDVRATPVDVLRVFLSSLLPHTSRTS